jgi:hypothetical protein
MPTTPSPIPSRPSDSRDWPRDFDIRARYAEQQDLLGEAAGRPAAADTGKGPQPR